MITELNKKAWALNGLEEPLEEEKATRDEKCDDKDTVQCWAALLGSAQQLYRLRHLNATRIVDPFITIPDHT
jgi:hypothetical protein